MINWTDSITALNSKINMFIWDKLGLVLLIFTGILFTFSSHFFQVRYFYHWLKKTAGSFFSARKKGDGKTISQIQALCTCLASTIGVGNIVGVSAAIKTGGSGAVFWMWIAAFLSMMTAFAENVLGIYFREKNKTGEWQGGAMYILKNGTGSKKGFKTISKALAVMFCIFCVLASFGIGNLGQVNKITENIVSSFNNSFLSSGLIFGFPAYNLIIAAFLTILCGFVILGGINRIASLAEKLVPFMVLFFIGGSLIVILSNKDNIFIAIKEIITNAFTVNAAAGAAGGITLKNIITTGCKRGMFSNEAGLGSTVLINVSSDVKEPAIQGMWGIFQVFVDTFLVCSMTALVILTSGISLTLGDSVLVAKAFSSVFGSFGDKFVAICIFMFAFTSIIGWSQYGCSAIKYLNLPFLEKAYKLLFIATIPLGALIDSTLAWNISDTFNGLMMLPNLIALILLSPLVIQITNNYIERNIKKKKAAPMLSFNKNIELKHQMSIKRQK